MVGIADFVASLAFIHFLSGLLRVIQLDMNAQLLFIDIGCETVIAIKRSMRVPAAFALFDVDILTASDCNLW